MPSLAYSAAASMPDSGSGLLPIPQQPSVQAHVNAAPSSTPGKHSTQHGWYQGAQSLVASLWLKSTQEDILMEHAVEYDNTP